VGVALGWQLHSTGHAGAEPSHALGAGVTRYEKAFSDYTGRVKVFRGLWGFPLGGTDV